MSKFGWLCFTIMFIVFSVNMTITCIVLNSLSANRDRSWEIQVVGDNTTIKSYPADSGDISKHLHNIEIALGVIK